MRILLRTAAALALAFSAGTAATVRAGLNSGKLLVDPKPSYVDANFRHNVHVSILKEFPMTHGAGLVGFGYEGRGANLVARVTEDGYTSEVKSKATMTYLTIPVGFQFEDRRKMETRGYLALRLVPSILLESEEDFSYRETEAGEVVDEGSEFIDQRDDTSPFDLVVEAEAGLSFPIANVIGAGMNRFLLGIGVGYGLIDINDPENEDELEEDPDYTHMEMNSLIFRVYGGLSF